MNNELVILSKKEFRDICKSQPDVTITATTDLKEAKEKEASVSIRGVNYRVIRHKRLHTTKGYVMLDDGSYARVEKFNLLAVILPLLLILVLLLFATPLGDKAPKPLQDLIGLEDTADISDDPATSSLTFVDVPGFHDEIELDQNTPNLALRNPDGNGWNLYYVLTENDATIYETKMITPGKQHNCNLKSVLANGWHTVSILTYTATKEGLSTGTPVASQTIRVHIS